MNITESINKGDIDGESSITNDNPLPFIDAKVAFTRLAFCPLK